jgi:hypothetical protein
MKRIGLVAASLATVSSLCFAGGAASKPTGACYTVWVSAPAPSGKATPLRRSLSFSARQILDLEFLVALPSTGLSAGKQIELRLFTPRGHLYQTLSMPSADPEPSSRRRPRYRTVTATLPVAGTTIVNNSLYGAWRAEAYVEGESSPCARPRVFEIQP